jgi:hypothetical protein
MKSESWTQPIEKRRASSVGTLSAELRRLADRAIGAVRSADVCDLLASAVLVALAIVALLTVKDYAISNDEGVQQQYGELIIAYYKSGFVARELFSFQNLYLYGGLFDIVAVMLAKIVPLDPFELRHLLCAMAGIGGIAASAATARMIAGPRAGLIAAIALAVCGAWYGAMFNHTKDIPFAAAMMGATLFLVRIARRLPSPRLADILAFGLMTGLALGVRSLGLLLLVYLWLAIVLYLPWPGNGTAWLRLAGASLVRTFPAVALAWLIMILAWPWAFASPLNPIRGLLAFSEFHYAIRTAFAGHVYEMADVPRIYVPGYLAVRLPLITLAGAALAIYFLLFASRGRDVQQFRRDVVLVTLTVAFPLTCQVALHGPAFTGIRHFLFLLPSLAVLAGIGLSELLDALKARSRRLAYAGVALIVPCLVWEATTLVRLHPYENLSYNILVGGLPGAYRRYDLDYWFNSMPEAIHQLEAFVRAKAPVEAAQASKVYSVAVCGERLSFDRNITLPQLRWDFGWTWEESEFFIAPTHMNCDLDLDGEIVATVERFGVPIAYVKDRRAIVKRPIATAASPAFGQHTSREEN